MGRVFSFILILFLFFSSAGSMPAAHAQSTPTEEALWKGLYEQFLYSEELLFKFDGAVARGETVATLIENPTRTENLYSALQASRENQEHLEEQLQARMMIQFSVEDSRSNQGGMESWVRKRAEWARQKLGIKNEAFLFAWSGVLGFAKEYDQSRGFGLESLSAPVVLEDFRKWRRKFRESGLKRGAGAEVREKISGQALELHSGLQERPQFEFERSDPSLTVFPSIGGAGNITGAAYPEGVWSLTFDDGPATLTGSVVRNLKSHGLKASFFVLTALLERSSELAAFAREAIQDGHDVYSHSYHHLKIPKLAPSDQYFEIEEALRGFESILGFRPSLFRLPYGAGVNLQGIRDNLVKSCQVHVFWNVDTLDWQDRDPASIVERTQAQMKTLRRGVILFHDIHLQSVIASEKIMAWLNSEGLKTIPLSEHVRDRNGGRTWSCTPSWSKRQN